MQAWNAFLESLYPSLGKEIVTKWLCSLEIQRFDAANLYLEAKDPFQVTWFEEHVRPLVKNHLKNASGRPIKVHLTSPIESKKKTKSFISSTASDLEIKSDPLPSFFSFENFVISDENKEMVSTLFNSPLDGTYNPLFLFGPPSSGKTHLLTALAHRYKAQGHSVFYVHAETFTSHIVQAIRRGQMEKIREIYRNFDLLIVEEVSKFGGRNATQEEFFHTFNTLYAKKKQLILSSVFPPYKLEGIEPRLISRFEWGMQLSLKPLPLSQRGLVLENQSKEFHFPLSKEMHTFLIERFPSSIEATLKAFQALMLRCPSPEALSIEQATTLLQDLLEGEDLSPLTPKQLFMEVARYFEIGKEELLGPSHAKLYSFPRKLAMYACREFFDLSYPEIGKLFKRDHSTVMAAVKQIAEKKEEKEIALHLKKIQEKIKKTKK